MTKGNEPAFPGVDWVDTRIRGLTKREYFAAKAMQGMLANGGIESITLGPNSQENNEVVAGVAVVMADALIKELEK